MSKRLAALLALSLTAAEESAGRSPGSGAGKLSSPPHYNLTVRVLPDDRRLEVSGTMRLASEAAARSEIVLSLSERMRQLHVDVVEPPPSAGTATAVRVDDSGTNSKWAIRPPAPFPPGEPILLRFSCVGDGAVAPMYYIGPEVAFASAWGTDWYPLLQGAAGKGTGEITLVVPAGWSVATGGPRLGRTQEEAEPTFRSAVPHPTYFSFAAAKYTVAEAKGAVPLSAHLLSRRDHIEPHLQGVQRILRALTQEFGPYPFDALTLAEVPRDLANKAGFNAVGAAGLLLLNSRAFDAPDTKYLLEWLGHELAHQWFPHAVALRTPPGLYMEEALAEYGALRVVERIQGPEAAKRLRTSGFEYDPIYSARAYFTLVGKGIDHPLADLQPKLEHRDLAYNKGSLVFDMLSREVGRNNFQDILRRTTRKHRFQSISWSDFLEAVALASRRKLDWFFEQWFNRTGAPDFRLSWHQEGETLRGVVEQPEPYYRARLNVEIRGESRRRVHVVETAGPRTAFVRPVRFRVDSAVLDPDYEVLRWTPEYRAAADAARLEPNRKE